MTREERNTNVSVTTRCFCSLGTASNIPREHSHAQQHNPLSPHAYHQREHVSSITLVSVKPCAPMQTSKNMRECS